MLRLCLENSDPCFGHLQCKCLQALSWLTLRHMPVFSHAAILGLGGRVEAGVAFRKCAALASCFHIFLLLLFLLFVPLARYLVSSRTSSRPGLSPSPLLQCDFCPVRSRSRSCSFILTVSVTRTVHVGCAVARIRFTRTVNVGCAVTRIRSRSRSQSHLRCHPHSITLTRNLNLRLTLTCSRRLIG